MLGATLLAACSSSSSTSPAGSTGSPAADSTGGQPAALTPITVSLPHGPSGDTIPSLIAVADNIFAKYGLKVTIDGVSTAVQFTALAKGDADIAVGSFGGLEAAAAGAPVQVIGTLGPGYTTFYSKSSIKTPQEMKGGTVGSSAPGSVSQGVGNAYLTENGLTLNDFKTVFFNGVSASAFAAFASGRLDGISTSPPYIYQLNGNNNVHALARMDKQNFAVLTSNAVSVNTTWASAHPDLVKDFIRAWLAAIAAMKTPAGMKTEVAALAKAADISTADATDWVTQQAPESTFRAVTNADMVWIRDAYGVNSPAIKTAPTSKMVNNSYVNGI